jgi:uncharacterized RDD family membrane protein YckC
MTEATLQPASPLKRFAAFCYDLLLLAGLIAVFTLLTVLARGGVAVAPGSVWFQVVLLAIVVGFYGWFWTHGGQTLGMRAWRVRIVSGDATELTWSQALLRLAAGVVALLPLGLGLWWGFLDGERRAWHDRLTGTRVVRVPPRGASAPAPPPPS